MQVVASPLKAFMGESRYFEDNIAGDDIGGFVGLLLKYDGMAVWHTPLYHDGKVFVVCGYFGSFAEGAGTLHDAAFA